MEASSISWDYCRLTDECLDSIGSFASLSLGVNRQVSYIVCTYRQLVLEERKGANSSMTARLRSVVSSACLFLSACVSSHLSSTQANIELVEIFGSFGGKARPVHQGPHRPKEAEVEC